MKTIKNIYKDIVENIEKIIGDLCRVISNTIDNIQGIKENIDKFLDTIADGSKTALDALYELT